MTTSEYDRMCSLQARVKELEEALRTIAGHDKLEMLCDPATYCFDAEMAYRAGSHNAFCELADIAREALKGQGEK